MFSNNKEVRIIDGVEHQKCCRCKEFKTLDNFSISRGRHHTVCKGCKKIYDKAYREKTKERRAKKAKEYRKLHYDELIHKAHKKYRENPQKYIDRSNDYRRRKVNEN